MNKRRKHPHKEIEKVVAYAETLGWRVTHAHGNAWCYLYCPHAERSGCKVGVWSTPKNPENHARHVRRQVDSCPHVLKADISDDSKD